MRKTVKFASELQNIAKAEEVLDKISQTIEIDEPFYGTILLVLSEAINNAIVHGNKLNPNKKVTLSYKINKNVLEFEIEDEGEGFDPDSIPDPTAPENIEKEAGRGIFIIKNLCDEVEFQKNGSKLKLKFYLPNKKGK